MSIRLLKDLIWSDPAPPCSGNPSYYDHVISETPLGGFRIEWKSWKTYDTYAIYFNEEYIDSGDTLEDAKTKSYNWLNDKIVRCVN